MMADDIVEDSTSQPAEYAAPPTSEVPPIVSVEEAPPPVELTPAPQVEATAKGTCKTCKSRLEVYAGENPAKLGTGFCATCGNRQLLKG